MTADSSNDTYIRVDEHNDCEGETFGVAVPSTEANIALFRKWKQSTEDAAAADPLFKTNLTFHFGPRTRDWLEAFASGANNSYRDRVTFSDDNSSKLIADALQRMPAGSALDLYKGNLIINSPGPGGNGERQHTEVGRIVAVVHGQDTGEGIDDRD